MSQLNQSYITNNYNPILPVETYLLPSGLGTRDLATTAYDPIGTVIFTNNPLPSNYYIVGLRINTYLYPSVIEFRLAKSVGSNLWDILTFGNTAIATITGTTNNSSGYEELWFSEAIQVPAYGSYYTCIFSEDSKQFSRYSNNGYTYRSEANLTGLDCYVPPNTYQSVSPTIDFGVQTIISRQLGLSLVELEALKKGEEIVVPSLTTVSLQLELPLIQPLNILELISSVSGTLQTRYQQALDDVGIFDGLVNYDTNYATPAMTSYTAPTPYVVSATSYSTSEPDGKPWYAFSQNLALPGWFTNAVLPQAIMIQLDQAQVINAYSLLGHTYYSYPHPMEWVFQGLKSGIETPDVFNDDHWETLDNRSGITTLPNGEWHTYGFLSQKSYKAYRLQILKKYYVGTSSNKVGIKQIKLIEAQGVYTAPSYEWVDLPITITTTGSAFIYQSQPPPTAVVQLEFSNPTTSGCSLQLSNTYQDPKSLAISSSGTVRTFIPVTDTLTITNTNFTTIIPYYQLQYTNNFDIDTKVATSPDYMLLTPSGKGKWYSLADGLAIPEQFEWNCGAFYDTVVKERKLTLLPTARLGTWLSPVVDSKYDPLWLYVYGPYLPTIKVKASNSPPSEAIFTLITTENTHQSLMYQHKRIVFDSHGYIIANEECPDTSTKLWRVADSSFANNKLRYHSSMNTYGDSCFMAPGVTECGDMDPIQEYNDALSWHHIYTNTLATDSQWSSGITVSGLPTGPKKTVILTRTFPVASSNAFFIASVVTSAMYDDPIKTQVYLTFVNSGNVFTSMPMVTIFGQQLTGSDHCDIQYDWANNGWWVYLGGSIRTLYKIDVGSFDTARFMGDGSVPNDAVNYEESYYLGYLYDQSFIDYDFTGLVGIPDNTFSGFWAFSASGIYLYQELNEQVARYSEFTYSNINEATFSGVLSGACDSTGNLWAVIYDQSRLVRINFNKAINKIEQPIDYDNQLPGLLAVYPHSTDGSAYVVLSDTAADPGKDTLQRVNVAQSSGTVAQKLCDIPGFCSAPFPGGVDFTGVSHPAFALPTLDHPVWGLEGNWQPYDSGKSILPRGRYKQILLEFTRSETSLAAPVVTQIRAPKPIELPPLEPAGTIQLALKTSFDTITKGYGDNSFDIIAWWEET